MNCSRRFGGPMTIREAWQRFSLIAFALSGFGSAWLTVWVDAEVSGHRRFSGFLFVLGKWTGWGSLTFGLFLAVCLWLFMGLRSIWKTVCLIVMSPVAAMLAFLAAFSMALRLRIGGWAWEARTADLKSYFIGGFVGSFLLSLLVPWVLGRKIPLRRRILESLCCAIVGGSGNGGDFGRFSI
jgi:hypothetical protein